MPQVPWPEADTMDNSPEDEGNGGGSGDYLSYAWHTGLPFCERVLTNSSVLHTRMRQGDLVNTKGSCMGTHPLVGSWIFTGGEKMKS